MALSKKLKVGAKYRTLSFEGKNHKLIMAQTPYTKKELNQKYKEHYSQEHPLAFRKNKAVNHGL